MGSPEGRIRAVPSPHADEPADMQARLASLEAEAEEVGQADQPVLDRVVISRRAFLPSDLRSSPPFQTEVKRPGAWAAGHRPAACLTASFG